MADPYPERHLASSGVVVARVYLYLISATFLAVGMTALLSPQHLAAFFDLQAQTERGVAELRSLYGGLFLSLGALTLYALRKPKVAQDLLGVVGVLMGSVAAARIASMAVDREITFTLPAAGAEALVSLACWTLVRAPNQASAGGSGGSPDANIV